VLRLYPVNCGLDLSNGTSGLDFHISFRCSMDPMFSAQDCSSFRRVAVLLFRRLSDMSIFLLHLFSCFDFFTQPFFFWGGGYKWDFQIPTKYISDLIVHVST